MRTIYASETGTLVLGFQGEDQRLEIRFPLVDEKTGRNITEEFPGGSFSISIMLPGDPAEHIVGSEDFRIEGNWLIWTVKEAYTVGFGEGKLQLNYAFGGMVKSRIWKTNVRKSINSGSGTVPSWSDWKTELLNAAAAVESAVDSYDEMTAEAEDGDQTSAHIDRMGDHPVLHIEIKNNGGGGGADIDDSTTASNKTWSSQKISDELDTKADEEDLSSLSETIGNLVAVQSTEPTSQTNKMWIDPEGNSEVQLALYSDIHSPLSKILDVTLEEESALIVTEIGGVQLSAEELDMLVYAPTGTAIAAGTAYVYNGQTGLGDAYHVARTASDTGIYWCARWMKQGGVWASEMGRSFSSGNLVQPYRYFVNELANERYGRSVIDYPKITQIKLPTLPANTRIILYAR